MKTADIIVLAGQSNAVGVGYVKYLSKHFSPEKTAEFINGYSNPAINYFSHDIKSGGFVNTRVCCAEKTKETFGPEIGLAEQLHARYPDRDMFIVKCAVGATSMNENWRSPNGNCYVELLALLNDSIRILQSRGYSPEIRAFCWMQGESDSYEKEHADQYIELYDAMIKSFDEEFGAYLHSCVYIDGGISSLWKFHKEINDGKTKYAKENEGHRYIDTIAAGLNGNNEPEEAPDTVHYDSDSVIKLGRMFAEQITL